MDFVTQSAEYHSLTLKCSAVQIERLYPDATFYIYDGGLDTETRDFLSDISNTEVIDWPITYSPERLDRIEVNLPNILERFKLSVEQRISETTYIEYIAKEIFGLKYASRVRRRGFFMMQKELVTLDCIKYTDGNLIWFDSDVILLNTIDELFQDTYDIGITLRPKVVGHRKTVREGGLQTNDDYHINAGVIFYNTASRKIRDFIEEWLDMIEKLPLSTNLEQTALAELLKINSEKPFEKYYNNIEINTDKNKIKVKTFPCHIYNYFQHDYGFNPNQQKILHFKGKSYESEMAKEIIRSIEEGNKYRWTRYN